MSGLSPEQIGKALGGGFAGVSPELSVGQAALVGELHGLLAFEGTHPTKSKRHKRDVLHGIMAAESMSKGAMTTEDLRTLPSAGMLSGKEASEKGERPQEGRDGIQKGARDVTSKVASPKAPGFGEKPLPEGIEAPFEVRFKREVENFKRWIKATGGLDRIEGRAPDKEDLKRVIRERLDKFLASFKSDVEKGS